MFTHRCFTVLAVSVLILAVFNINGCTHVADAAKGKMAQLEEEFKKGTVLIRAKGQLADARKSRTQLKEIADKFHVDSEVALRQTKRLEEEKENILEKFKRLQDAAKKAELPKYIDATAEDKAKTFQIGAKTFTGEETYRCLKDYKTQVEKADKVITRERKRADFLKGRAEKIRTQMLTQVDDNIAEMENDIADYEMHRELFMANQTVEALSLSNDQMDKLLKTDGIVTELRKKIDEMDIQNEMNDQANRGKELDSELGDSSSFSITDDDLI